MWFEGISDVLGSLWLHRHLSLGSARLKRDPELSWHSCRQGSWESTWRCWNRREMRHCKVQTWWDDIRNRSIGKRYRDGAWGTVVNGINKDVIGAGFARGVDAAGVSKDISETRGFIVIANIIIAAYFFQGLRLKRIDQWLVNVPRRDLERSRVARGDLRSFSTLSKETKEPSKVGIGGSGKEKESPSGDEKYIRDGLKVRHEGNGGDNWLTDVYFFSTGRSTSIGVLEEEDSEATLMGGGFNLTGYFLLRVFEEEEEATGGTDEATRTVEAEGAGTEFKGVATTTASTAAAGDCSGGAGAETTGGGGGGGARTSKWRVKGSNEFNKSEETSIGDEVKRFKRRDKRTGRARGQKLLELLVDALTDRKMALFQDVGLRRVWIKEGESLEPNFIVATWEETELGFRCVGVGVFRRGSRRGRLFGRRSFGLEFSNVEEGDFAALTVLGGEVTPRVGGIGLSLEELTDVVVTVRETGVLEESVEPTRHRVRAGEGGVELLLTHNVGVKSSRETVRTAKGATFIAFTAGLLMEDRTVVRGQREGCRDVRTFVILSSGKGLVSKPLEEIGNVAALELQQRRLELLYVDW
ncbi:hypothetical protein BC829DRAFT_417273 [Chytridium lagenaria]|nr:hypothetical protein BC829DRAFT_417273 [Chytridium lagenaria]